MLKRVRIRGFKSLQDVEVHLGELAVIFGPNASGKSNFLDALQLLSRLVRSETLDEVFEPPYRGTPVESFNFHPGGMKELLERESASLSIEVDVFLTDAAVEWVNRDLSRLRRRTKPVDIRWRYLRYEVELVLYPKQNRMGVGKESVVALNKDGSPTGRRGPFVETTGEGKQVRVENTRHHLPFDRVAPYSTFGPVAPYSVLAIGLPPGLCRHLAALRREIESWSFYYLEPRMSMRQKSPLGEVRDIGPTGSRLAGFLHTLKSANPAQFKALEKSLSTMIPDASGIHLAQDDEGQIEVRIVEQGTPVPVRLISEGTLRVLGLLALACSSEMPGLIGFEEPENGIHPRRIKLVSEFLKSFRDNPDSQMIVTTHSPILPDMIPLENLYVCRKSQRKTEIRPYLDLEPAGSRKPLPKLLNGDWEQVEGPDEDVIGPSIRERLTRGDFDAD